MSNNVSLIEVIDEITIPAPPPEFVPETAEQISISFDANLVVLWTRSDLSIPEKAMMRSKIIAPNGDEALTPELEIDLTKTLRVRASGRVAGFPPLSESGEYTIRFETKRPDSDWQEESFELPLWISVQTDIPPDDARIN